MRDLLPTIVRSLSPMQAAVLRSLPLDGSEATEADFRRGISLMTLKEKKIADGVFVKLTEIRHPREWGNRDVYSKLTPLGRRVVRELRRQDPTTPEGKREVRRAEQSRAIAEAFAGLREAPRG